MPNFRNRMATQGVSYYRLNKHHLKNHRVSVDLCRGGTVAAPVLSTPMPLYINNILFILMINYENSAYLFTRLVAYTTEDAASILWEVKEDYPLISKAVADLVYHIRGGRGQNMVNWKCLGIFLKPNFVYCP